MADEKKRKKLKSIEDLHKKYEDSVVDREARAANTGFHSTGSLQLDKILNGGLPYGEIVECYGAPASGKSTVALAAAAQVIRKGGKVAYFDLERGLDFSSEKAAVLARRNMRAGTAAPVDSYEHARTGWLRKNGIDPFSDSFHCYSPEHGEEMFAMIGDMIEAELFDLIIVDSVAAIMTRAQLEGEPGDATFGAVAKLLSAELARLMRLFDRVKAPRTTIVLINQSRDKIGYMSNGGTKSFGGKATEYYVGTKLKFARLSRKERGGDVITETKVTVEKTRKAAVQSCVLQISSERGIDRMGELIETAKEAGLIHTSGNWHYIWETPVAPDVFKAAKKAEDVPGLLAKLNSESAALRWLAEHGWESRLTALTEPVKGSPDSVDTP